MVGNSGDRVVQAGRKEIVSLDGLRGIAAIFDREFSMATYGGFVRARLIYGTPVMWLNIILRFALLLFVAWLTWRYVEEPLRRFLTRKAAPVSGPMPQRP